MTGTVYLVGAGPGDPELMTVKATRLLREADAIVHDALIDKGVLKGCNAELYDAGKRGGDHKMSQAEINRLLVDLAQRHRFVVRLKGGDPFMFGRGAEEAAVLRDAGIDVHVVPGVSSAISVPELAGIPVTHRGHASAVTFITGNERANRDTERISWKDAVAVGGTIVVLMGMENAATISERLIDGGMDPTTPAAVITDGSMRGQRKEITTISDLGRTISEKRLKAPGIIVIGTVVNESEKLGDMS